MLNPHQVFAQPKRGYDLVQEAIPEKRVELGHAEVGYVPDELAVVSVAAWSDVDG